MCEVRMRKLEAGFEDLRRRLQRMLEPVFRTQGN